MIPVALSWLALLAIPQLDQPPAADAAPAVPATGVDGSREAALARYNAMREKTPETAAAQWKLAVWCEQNGLAAEAYTHFAAVVQHDPKREAAWRKLGFKKRDGRWMTDEQIAEDEEQKKADKIWAPLLKKHHKEIHGGKNQAETEEELGRITDPKAVPALYREFGGGGEQDQKILVQVLGQIDSPIASKALAALAVYGKTPEVRRRATETLRGRRAEEFLNLLVAMMVDPIKYHVKPVGGPGSPGALVVEGERANTQRIYAPPPPTVTPRPGDVIGYDASGVPMIVRSGPTTAKGVPGSKTLVTKQTELGMFSLAPVLVEAQRAAMSAQAQLQNDVAQIEAINDARNAFNSLVMNVAKAATGKDLGKTPKEWRDAVAAAPQKYAKQPTRTTPKPTLSELASLVYIPNYNPVLVQTAFLRQTVVDT
jgi:hypothetical protein